MPGELDAVKMVVGWLSSKPKPNPNDWKGWTYGDAKKWVAEDGDSVQNEAANIASFMGKPGFDLSHMYDDSDGYHAVTYAQIQNKLQRGGFSSSSVVQPEPTSTFFNAVKSTGSIFKTASPTPENQYAPKKAGFDFKALLPIAIIVALIAVVAKFFKGKKGRRAWVFLPLLLTLSLNAQRVSNNGVKQLQSDWNALKGVTYIRNKPDIIKVSDSAAMLSGYAKSGHVVKYSDTSAMLLGYSRFGRSVQYADMPAFLAPYVTSASLSGYVPYSHASTVSIDSNTPFIFNSPGGISRYRIDDINNFNFRLNGSGFDLSIYTRFQITDAFGTRFSIFGNGNVNTVGSISAVSYTGQLATPSQPNITTVGALSALTVSGSLGLPGIPEFKRSKQLFYDPLTKVVSYGDTAAISGVSIDTATMLSGYAKSGHVVKYSDTAAMHLNLMKISDTAAMLSGYQRLGSGSGGSGVQYSDTAAMLSGYAKSGHAVKYGDTTTMLSGYQRLGSGVQYTDTATMLSGYQRVGTGGTGAGIFGTRQVSIRTLGGTVTLVSGADSISYYKVGRMVTVFGNITIATASGTSGDLVIDSLPFRCASLPGPTKYYHSSFYLHSTGWTGNIIAFGSVPPGSYSLETRRSFLNGLAGNDLGDFAEAGVNFYFNFSYLTDEGL